MQGTYPLFICSGPRTLSPLGVMCRPIERQLREPEGVPQALDCEVRAHSARGDLFVKFRPARWFKDAASRRLHRECAWDIARAALKTDIGRNFCAESPRMVDEAWRRAGMPPRGQPITLRQVIRLLRLADYLHAFHEAPVCDGSPASYQQASQRLAVALALYSRHVEAGVPVNIPAADTHDEVLPRLAARSWEQLRASPERGVNLAIERALEAFSPTRQAPAAPAAVAAPDSLNEEDFLSAPRPGRSESKSD